MSQFNKLIHTKQYDSKTKDLNNLLLCWIPSGVVIYSSIVLADYFSNSTFFDFLRVRYFLVTLCCIPFLVFKIRDRARLILGLIVPIASVFLFDTILEFLFTLKPTPYISSIPGISFWEISSLVLLLIACFLLRRKFEETEIENSTLAIQLKEKSASIQQQAADEVHQLNQQLRLNIQQLSEREFILNQSQRIAKIGSWEYRIEDNFLYWSDEMYNIFGLNRGFDLQTKNLEQILWGMHSGLLIDATNTLLKDGKPYDLTLRATTPIGYHKWVRIYGYAVEENNQIVGAQGICHDVTFYKEAEEQLRTTEEKFSKAFENNPDLIIIIREEDTILIDANSKLLDVLGYRREEILGQPTRDLNFFLNKEDEVRFFAAYKDEGQVSFECPCKRKNGQIIQVIISSTRIQIRDAYYVMSVIKDITDRKLAEEKFSKAFDLSPDLMLIFREKDLVLVETNRKIEEVFGYQRGEVLGVVAGEKTLDSWTDPEEGKVFFQHYLLHGSHSVEARLKRKNGNEFFATVSAQRIVLFDEYHIIIVIRDVTEEKNSKEDLILSQANLNATINNTEIMIWSVDRYFNLMTFNRPFENYIFEQYGIKVQHGARIFRGNEGPEYDEMKKRWSQNYLRTLAGELVTLEETVNGRDFYYSLSPIIEDEKVMGVSVFAENVTERKIRNRELAEANKQIGELKLMALRSVMNPHFVFNVLNSIQYFIAKNDRLNAINYLSTFSKLIRSILTHSMSNKIKLSEEVEMLRNYIDLELTRFETKFDFVLEIDQSVDLEAIEIPPLLIQPYVENAILHGLYNKVGRGQLRIRMSEKVDSLYVEIEDDGIGREAAMKLRDLNFPKHKSVGIQLTEERLKLINAQHNVSFEVHDLEHGGNTIGTRVKIRINLDTV
jgi:PAS domain S-box-containing protein